jgi:hypothetical protein
MADRYPTYFGPPPAGPVADSEAFSAEELVQIRARRIELDMARCGPSGWPEQRRFRTMGPATAPRAATATAPHTIHTTARGVVIIVS